MSLSQHHQQGFVEAAFAASDDCIKIIDLDGALQFMSDGGKRVMEVDDFTAVHGCHWPDFWQDEANAEARAAVAAAREGKSARFLGYANTLKGRRRFWDVKVSPILAGDGSVERILSVSRDITALKDYEVEQELLRNELSHRMKNIFALVQSVANLTLKNDDAMAVAKPAFLKRLRVLSHAHQVLLEREGAQSLHAVVDAIVADQPFGRIEADGPDVAVSSRIGLAFSLTLHELVTNATKYGALSTDNGRVAIRWHVDGAGRDGTLGFSWIESGGPEVSTPSIAGFGSRMIEAVLAAYLEGAASTDYRPDGLVFTLCAPVRALTRA